MRHFMNRTLLRSVMIVILAIPTAAVAMAPQDRQEARTEPTVQRMKSGFVLAPDFKFGEVDGEFAGFAGAYGGRLIDDTLLIGGGVYWLANGSEARKMAYGGALVEYIAKPSNLIHVSVRGLVGVGTSTLSVEVTGFDGGRRSFDRFRNDRGRGPERRLLLFRDDFVLAEPQANVFFNLARWVRLGLGASYRFIGATGLDDRLAGPSGNFSVVFGSF